MSDNLRRYHAIHTALTQAYPAPPTGNLARHLNTLAALISGIVGSKSTQLPCIAAKVPNGTTTISWKRCIFYPMRTSCSVISPSRPWCSSWMAVWRAAVAWP